MLSFFRRILYSRVGVVITMGGLIIIALAFALGDVTGLRGGGGSRVATGDVAATVGKTDIMATDLQRETQTQFRSFQRQQPGLTMAQFLAGGGLDGSIDHLIDGLALDSWAKSVGVVIGKKAIDGEIASIPQFHGLDGKFDEKTYNQALATAQITPAQFRREVAGSLLSQLLEAPTRGAAQVPDKVAVRFASLLLERRTGAVAFVPTLSVGLGGMPTDKELADYYRRNIARYTIPERRTIRYALVTPDSVKALAVPTDAEIEAAYKISADKYAAHETRTISQVVIADKAAADAVAAKVKGGASIADAARGSGLEPAVIKDVDKAGYAAQTSGDVANAVFTAGAKATVGPVKGALGWIVAHVDAVTQIPAKTIAQVKPELVKQLSATKETQLLTDIRSKIDNALNASATFDDIVVQQRLTSAVTPPLSADGRDPTNPKSQADPALNNIVAAGFQSEQGDQPQLVPVGTDGGFALVAVDRVTTATPAPLAQIKAGVVHDFQVDRALATSRKLANDVVAKVNGGTPLATAIAQTGVKAPPISPLNASRAELVAQQQRVPPPLALMFSMQGKTAKLLEAPNNAGWLIVYLDSIQRGDASNQPTVIRGMRADMGRTTGAEYVAQFRAAVRSAVGVNRNADAIAKVRNELSGSSQP